MRESSKTSKTRTKKYSGARYSIRRVMPARAQIATRARANRRDQPKSLGFRIFGFRLCGYMVTAARAKRRNQPKDGTHTILSVSGSKEAVEQAVARVHAIIADPPARLRHLSVPRPLSRSLSVLHLHST